MSERGLRIAAGAAALAGAAIAGYLTWVHYDESALVCVAGGGCETVQRSAYSEIAGIRSPSSDWSHMRPYSAC